MTIAQVTTATNKAAPDTSVAQNDARRYFNNFYSETYSVGPANDAIVAFFEQYAENRTSAKNLAAVVLYTAQAQKLDPMVVLSEFQKLPKGQLSTYLAAFLNINRAPTSLIAIKTGATSNPLITRSVLL